MLIINDVWKEKLNVILEFFKLKKYDQTSNPLQCIEFDTLAIQAITVKGRQTTENMMVENIYVLLQRYHTTIYYLPKSYG